MNKNDMARIVIQALYALADLPAADDRRVVKTARQPKNLLANNYRTALVIIRSGVKLPN